MTELPISRLLLPALLVNFALVISATYHQPWHWGLALCFMLWRALIYVEKARYPSPLLKTLLVLLVSAVVVAVSGRAFTLENALSFLLAGSLLKLLEMRTLRDAYVIIFAMIFLLATGFLFKQSIGFTLYALSIFYLLITSLILLHYSGLASFKQSLLHSFKIAASLLVFALPLMLALYLLFPRLGPLWSFTLQSGQAKTGLTSEMTVGNITDLVQSDELVFRATFTGNRPPVNALYWRALVLDFYDGRTWSMPYPEPVHWYQGQGAGDLLSYEIIQEASHEKFLFALGSVTALSPDTGVTDKDNLRAKKPLYQRLKYQAAADFTPHPQALDSAQRKQALQLPAQLNSQTRRFAQQLRNQYPQDAELIAALLQHFNQQNYYYSLKNAPLGEHEIDEFLFQTKQGFCAHYASAMSFVLRSAGIPARVVAGYQGGQWHQTERYLTVRQFDAHAWVEAYVDGRWQSFDPTFQVAPERILFGLEQALAAEGSFLAEQMFSAQKLKHIDWLKQTILRLETVNFYWQRWVLSYDQTQQQRFLSKVVGIESYQYGLYLLAVGFALLFISAALWLKWQNRAAPQSALLKAWRRLQKSAAQQGLASHVGETPAHYCQRLAECFPHQQVQCIELADNLTALLYQQQSESRQAQLHKTSLQLLKKMTKAVSKSRLDR